MYTLVVHRTFYDGKGLTHTCHTCTQVAGTYTHTYTHTHTHTYTHAHTHTHTLPAITIFTLFALLAATQQWSSHDAHRHTINQPELPSYQRPGMADMQHDSPGRKQLLPAARQSSSSSPALPRQGAATSLGSPRSGTAPVSVSISSSPSTSELELRGGGRVQEGPVV